METELTKNKKHVPASSPQAPPRSADILRNLDRETVCFNGDEISMLEAGIRLLYARSLNGDLGASLELQRIRDRCGAETVPKAAGCLVVPEAISLEEWTRRAHKQQAPFREQRYPGEEA